MVPLPDTLSPFKVYVTVSTDDPAKAAVVVTVGLDAPERVTFELLEVHEYVPLAGDPAAVT